MGSFVRAAAAMAALCFSLIMATPAQALLVLLGGTASTQPASGTNQLFGPLYGRTTVDGYLIGRDNPPAVDYGIVLDILGPSIVDFYYLGSEAAFRNVFQVDTGTGFGGPGGIAYTTPGITGAGDVPASPLFLGSFLFDGGSFPDSLLPFRFLADGGPGGVQNGRAEFACRDCSVFLTFLDANGDPTTKKFGRVLDMFFDDGQTDDNHDDMAIRVVVTRIPVPAALPILLVALAGFGLAGYRSRRRA